MRKNVLIKIIYNCQSNRKNLSNWITNSREIRKPHPEKTRYLKCFSTRLNLINRSVCIIQRNLTISNLTSIQNLTVWIIKTQKRLERTLFFKKKHIAGRNVKIEGLKGKFKHFQDLTRNIWRTRNKFKNTRNNFSCWGDTSLPSKSFYSPFLPKPHLFYPKGINFLPHSQLYLTLGGEKLFVS